VARYILTTGALKKILYLTKGEAEKIRFKRLAPYGNGYIIKFHTSTGTNEIYVDLNEKLYLPFNFKTNELGDDHLTRLINSQHRNMVVDINQIGWERVVQIGFPDGSNIIIELFSGGNMIYLDSDKTILAAYREFEGRKRSVKRGIKYVLPTMDLNRLIMDDREYKRRELFRILPLDPMTIEAWFNKDVWRANEIVEKIEEIQSAIDDSLKDDTIYLYRYKEKLYIQPTHYTIGELEDKGPLNQISEKILKNILLNEKADKAVYDEITKLRERLAQLYGQREAMRKALDETYSYINQIEAALSAINSGEDPGNNEIGPFKISRIDRKEKTAILRVDGAEIPLRYDINIYASISQAYDTLKRIDEGIKNLENKLRELETSAKHTEKQRLERKIRLKRRWFEKFIWSYTRKGRLLIAGRDATTNEVLVKKYTSKDDLVFHAEIHGSPFTILKGGVDADSDELIDAATITASYSNAWKHGLSYVPVYYVKPEQISKEAPSGQYLKKGSFMIYGEKSYVRGHSISLYITLIELEEEPRIFIGTREAISSMDKKPDFYIYPGKTGKGEIAKKIIEHYVAQGLVSDEYREALYNDLVNRLPPGKSGLKKL